MIPRLKYLKLKHVTSYMFAETTHIVAASSFIKICSRVFETHAVKIWPFSLLQLLGFTMACTESRKMVVA